MSDASSPRHWLNRSCTTTTNKLLTLQFSVACRIPQPQHLDVHGAKFQRPVGVPGGKERPTFPVLLRQCLNNNLPYVFPLHVSCRCHWSIQQALRLPRHCWTRLNFKRPCLVIRACTENTGFRYRQWLVRKSYLFRTLVPATISQVRKSA